MKIQRIAFFYLYSDKNKINDNLKENKITDLKILKFFHTSTVVSDEETPLTAIKNSKDSSMWHTINSQVNEKADISLSAGNTGVLFVISRMILKTIDQVSKPALAGLWPNKNGVNVVLDLGANIECDENNLIDFSEMGSTLYKALFNGTPKVALLNIGSEEIKGTENLKSPYQIKDISRFGDFDFNGYIEGNELFEGNSDNYNRWLYGQHCFKTAEGTAKFITDSLKKSLTENIFSKFSILFSYFR